MCLAFRKDDLIPKEEDHHGDAAGHLCQSTQGHIVLEQDVQVILKEGKLLSPLIVWGNTLVDGHNRYAILQKHPEICFSTMPLRFENREEAIAWICRNQLGRRNLSPEQKRYLLGKQYESEKKAEKIFHGNQYTLAKKSGGSHDDTHHSGKKTCDRIAEENGVSRASVLRASHYTRGHRHRR